MLTWRSPAPPTPCAQVVRSRLQQRMDSRALQYSGVGDVVRKTLQVRPRRCEGWARRPAGVAAAACLWLPMPLDWFK